MNESPAPTVSTISYVGTGGQDRVGTAHSERRALAPAGDHHQGRPQGQPVLHDVVDGAIRVEPLDVLVADLDDIGENDDLLHAVSGILGVAHQGGPRIGVIGDGGFAVSGLERTDHLRPARFEGRRDASRVHVVDLADMGQGWEHPGEVEVVGGVSLCVDLGVGHRGPRRLVAARNELDIGAPTRPGDPLAPAIGADPGGQSNVVPEAPQTECDVRRAASHVLVDIVAAGDNVHQRFAHHQDAGLASDTG